MSTKGDFERSVRLRSMAISLLNDSWSRVLRSVLGTTSESGSASFVILSGFELFTNASWQSLALPSSLHVGREPQRLFPLRDCTEHLSSYPFNRTQERSTFLRLPYELLLPCTGVEGR